jgi:hypothetical protein
MKSSNITACYIGWWQAIVERNIAIIEVTRAEFERSEDRARRWRITAGEKKAAALEKEREADQAEAAQPEPISIDAIRASMDVFWTYSALDPAILKCLSVFSQLNRHPDDYAEATRLWETVCALQTRFNDRVEVFQKELDNWSS